MPKLAMQLLLARVPGLTPGAKLFLLRWLVDGDQGLLEGSVRDMIERFAFNDRMIASSISCLIRIGVLKRLSAGKGKGWYSYRLVRENLQAWVIKAELMAGEDRESLVEQLLREKVIGSKSPGIKGVSRTCLTPSNKLLLLALLGLADQAGVVDSVTWRELTEITGISQSRLLRQLSKLQELGLVRGIRDPGTPLPFRSEVFIHVNMGSPKLGKAPTHEIMLWFESGEAGSHCRPVIEQLLEVVADVESILTKPTGFSVEFGFGVRRPVLPIKRTPDWESVLRFFGFYGSRQLSLYLESRLYRYVSELLSCYWGDIDDLNDEFRSCVRAMVEKDLPSHILVEAGTSLDKPKVPMRLLALACSEFVVLMAVNLREQLLRVRWPKELALIRKRLDRLTYVVQPPRSDGRHCRNPVVLCYDEKKAVGRPEGACLRLQQSGNHYRAGGSPRPLSTLRRDELQGMGLIGVVVPSDT